MFCPVCKGEFREGFTHCDDCNVDLVENLGDIPNKIDGEFMLCPRCQTEHHNGETTCNKCGMKLFRAVLNKDDEYVFLEEPNEESINELPDFGKIWKHYCEIDLSEAVTVLESVDGEMLRKVMQLLDDHAINFMFVEPKREESSLGSIFGMTSPMEPAFPKIVVRREDEEKALSLVANNSELGLFDVPEELIDDDEEDEDEE